MKITQLVFTSFAVLMSAAPAASEGYGVSWEGALKAVHHGDVSAKVSLRDFSGTRHLYAVGPVAGLDGEITVIDGSFYISRVRDGEVKTDSDLSTEASFLVWSENPSWRPPVMLGETAGNQEQLEELLKSLALNNGVDTSKPFPFLIDGTVKSVTYHVLAPRVPGSAASGHMSNAETMTSKDMQARIIGFFSKDHGGIFTHMGSMTHLHVLDNNGHTGHVDAIALDSEAMVLFPR